MDFDTPSQVQGLSVYLNFSFGIDYIPEFKIIKSNLQSMKY